MREHPWSMRRVTQQHLHDQRNLLDLMALTQAWQSAPRGPVAVVKADESTEATARRTDPSEKAFELEDDTTPSDVLARMEAEVWISQIRALSGKTSGKLDEASFEAGAKCAGSRWPTPRDRTRGAASDKRALFLALCHSPLAAGLGSRAFLIRRSLPQEISIELLQCPHRRLKEGEDAPADVIAELCRQHFNWMRGYLHSLNPGAHPVLTRPASRCQVSW